MQIVETRRLAMPALARFYWALGSRVRLALLTIIFQQKEIVVSTLVASMERTYDIDLSQPTISHHLRILRDAHLIAYHRTGTNCVYRCCHPEQVRALLAFALERDT